MDSSLGCRDVRSTRLSRCDQQPTDRVDGRQSPPGRHLLTNRRATIPHTRRSLAVRSSCSSRRDEKPETFSHVPDYLAYWPKQRLPICPSHLFLWQHQKIATCHRWFVKILLGSARKWKSLRCGTATTDADADADAAPSEKSRFAGLSPPTGGGVGVGVADSRWCKTR